MGRSVTTSTTTPTVPTEEEVRESTEEYRKARIHLDKIEQDKQAAIARINAKYAEVIAEREQDLRDHAEVIQLYTQANRRDLFEGDRKTTDLYGLEVAYKLSPPAIVPARKSSSWKTILAKLVKDKVGKKYVTVKESVNKTMLKHAGADVHKRFGVKLEQSESLIIKVAE
jgi:phage host-nuclease inhibitor protein Gam